MRKTAKRTDLAIIIILAIIALLIFFAAKTGKDSPAGEPEEVTLESINGRPLGAQPGSPSEAVISERFPDSPISYSTGFPELYTALTSKKIDGFVSSEVALRQMAKNHQDVTWLPEPLDTRYRYFGFARTEKGEDLCEEMNELLEDLNEDGTPFPLTSAITSPRWLSSMRKKS